MPYKIPAQLNNTLDRIIKVTVTQHSFSIILLTKQIFYYIVLLDVYNIHLLINRYIYYNLL